MLRCVSASTSRVSSLVRSFSTHTLSLSRMSAASTPTPIPSGLVAVYKPPGVTCSDVVVEVKKLLHVRRRSKSSPRLRVGHGGTLDRLACGLVLVGVGGGTKLLTQSLLATKEYDTIFQLGMATETLDLDEGAQRLVEAEGPYDHITQSDIESYLTEHYAASAGGIVEQVPPIYSALKVQGMRLSSRARMATNAPTALNSNDDADLDVQPAFDLAAAHAAAEAKVRPVHVHSISVTSWTPPFFRLRLVVGSGFYVRSLARDIGSHFQCGATMVALRRVEQHGFRLGEGGGSAKVVLDATQAMAKLKEKIRQKMGERSKGNENAATNAAATSIIPHAASVISSFFNEDVSMRGEPLTRDSIIRALHAYAGANDNCTAT